LKACHNLSKVFDRLFFVFYAKKFEKNRKYAILLKGVIFPQFLMQNFSALLTFSALFMGAEQSSIQSSAEKFFHADIKRRKSNDN